MSGGQQRAAAPSLRASFRLAADGLLGTAGVVARSHEGALGEVVPVAGRSSVVTSGASGTRLGAVVPCGS